MSALLYAATMSLDGFIAGVDGDMSWPAEHLSAPPRGSSWAGLRECPHSTTG